MGIRYEKDTILNWINEVGKFLRLLVGRWDDKVKDNSVVAEIEAGYQSFFEDDRVHFVQMSTEDFLFCAVDFGKWLKRHLKLVFRSVLGVPRVK